MKVVCIESNINIFRPDQALEEGHVYTVVGEDFFAGGLYYILAERGCDSAYNSIIFVHLSDIDETEFVRESIYEKLSA